MQGVPMSWRWLRTRCAFLPGMQRWTCCPAAESVEWLEQFLQRFPGTVVAVTHDRYFLDNAAGWILEMDRGQGIPWEGNYSSWLEQKEKRLEVDEGGARMGAAEPQGPPGEVESAPGALRGAFLAGAPGEERDPGDLHPG